MLTVRDGYLICPNCRRNKRLMKINPDTMAHRVVAFCRECARFGHRVRATDVDHIADHKDDCARFPELKKKNRKALCRKAFRK